MYIVAHAVSSATKKNKHINEMLQILSDSPIYTTKLWKNEVMWAQLVRKY
jgi:hypothetical protein